MSESNEVLFTDLVRKDLTNPECQLVWQQISQIMNVTNGGPENVKEHLDAERQQHELRIKNLIERMRESLGDL